MPTVTMPELNLDRERFLAQYWQREPLLIRAALQNFQPPCDANQLAGLAMEAEVESRIVEWREQQWLLHHGPFTTDDFKRDEPWTLLVQAVDHYLPEVAALRHLVNFIPQWRVDDVMVSYAVDGGSVGPHFDNYDVFLLQGEGQRLWQLGEKCDSTTALQPHQDLKLLSDFKPRQEFLLQTGDMLYVPPGVAHWGIARGDCTTFSIGFRAPRISDMVSRWIDSLLEKIEPDTFYADAGLTAVTRPGEIRACDMQRMISQLQAAVDHQSEQQTHSHWLGELVTEPRYETGPDDEATLSQARQALHAGTGCLYLAAAAKLAWQQNTDCVAIFANGESRTFPESVLAAVLQLCANWHLDRAEVQALCQLDQGDALLDYLLDSGCVYVE